MLMNNSFFMLSALLLYPLHARFLDTRISNSQLFLEKDGKASYASFLKESASDAETCKCKRVKDANTEEEYYWNCEANKTGWTCQCGFGEGCWKVCDHTENGQPANFYYNTITGVSTWVTDNIAERKVRVEAADEKILELAFYEFPLTVKPKDTKDTKSYCSVRELDADEKAIFNYNNKELKEAGIKNVRVRTCGLDKFKADFDQGHRHVFNFVIDLDEDKMFAIQTRQDENELQKFSKHLSLSNAAPRVSMAGTFRFVKSPTEYILVVDNDSGSYTPTTKNLAETKKLLQDNFPGLTIVTLDAQNKAQQNADMKKWVGPLEHPLPSGNSEEMKKYREKLTAFGVKEPAGGGEWEWSPGFCGK